MDFVPESAIGDASAARATMDKMAPEHKSGAGSMKGGAPQAQARIMQGAGGAGGWESQAKGGNSWEMKGHHKKEGAPDDKHGLKAAHDATDRLAASLEGGAPARKAGGEK